MNRLHSGFVLVKIKEQSWCERKLMRMFKLLIFLKSGLYKAGPFGTLKNLKLLKMKAPFWGLFRTHFNN